MWISVSYSVSVTSCVCMDGLLKSVGFPIQYR